MKIKIEFVFRNNFRELRKRTERDSLESIIYIVITILFFNSIDAIGVEANALQVEMPLDSFKFLDLSRSVLYLTKA